jgi:chorismate mutase
MSRCTHRPQMHTRAVATLKLAANGARYIAQANMPWPIIHAVRKGRRTPRAPRLSPPPPPPQVKTEESEEGFFRRESGAFSRDNPFQSGSSPPVPDKTPTSRRRTTGYESTRPKSSHRDEEDTHNAEERSSPAQIFQTPVSGSVRSRKPQLQPAPRIQAEQQLTLETGEEFTPEEQLELSAEEVIDGGTAVVPARRAGPVHRTNWGTPLMVMFVTLLSVYAGWFRQEKIAIGYCGVGRAVGTIPSEIPVPEWAQQYLGSELSVPPYAAEALEPRCEPCPSHAYCFGDFSVRCEQDYILKPHPLSLGGLVPLPPTCEPDGEKVRRVQAVADRAVEELRERTAKFECGQLTNEEGEKLESPAIEEQELKQIINQKRSKKLSDDEFEDLWGSAIGEIKAREEVEVEVNQ